MGRSADGIIIFGIAYEDEGVDPDEALLAELGIDRDSYIDLDDVARRAMEKRLGVEPPEQFDWSVYERQENESYSKARDRGDRLYQEWKKTDKYKAAQKHRDMLKSKVEDIGVDHGHHCHSDFGLRYICAYSITGGGGYCTELDLQEMMSLDTEKMTSQVREYCDLVKMPYEEPSWQLLGYYG